MHESTRSGDGPAVLRLPDGRRLAYAEYGDADGSPVFGFHGVLGSRLCWSLFDDVATERGVRLVAPERPGFGHSEFQRGRRFTDWPADVTALADHLGIDTFGVVGFSGGGPHALACAHAIPDRLRTVVLTSGITPPETHDDGNYVDELLTATRAIPGFSWGVFESANWLATCARPWFRATLVGSAAEPDRALFGGPAGRVLLDDAVETFRSGGRGPAHEFPQFGADWGFDVREVEPTVTLFHGRADATVPASAARAFGDLLGDCDLYLSGNAHYSTLVRERRAIIDAAT